MTHPTPDAKSSGVTETDRIAAAFLSEHLVFRSGRNLHESGLSIMDLSIWLKPHLERAVGAETRGMREAIQCLSTRQESADEDWPDSVWQIIDSVNKGATSPPPFQQKDKTDE